MKKVCIKCKKKKSVDDFGNDKSYKSGKLNICTTCSRERKKKNRDTRNRHIYLETEERLKKQTHKVCIKCKLNKPISEFRIRDKSTYEKRRQMVLNLHSLCRKCHDKVNSDRQKNNREAVYAYHKKWRDSRKKIVV